MSSLTSSYAGALILASMAALGAAYLGDKASTTVKMPEVALPTVLTASTSGTGAIVPATAPTGITRLIPNFPSVTSSMTEDEARTKLAPFAEPPAIDAMFKFVKTPVSEWNTLGDLNKLLLAATVHESKCREPLLKVCALVYEKYSQMKGTSKGEPPLRDPGNVWDKFAYLVSKLPSQTMLQLQDRATAVRGQLSAAQDAARGHLSTAKDAAAAAKDRLTTGVADAQARLTTGVADAQKRATDAAAALRRRFSFSAAAPVVPATEQAPEASAAPVVPPAPVVPATEQPPEASAAPVVPPAPAAPETLESGGIGDAAYIAKNPWLNPVPRPTPPVANPLLNYAATKEPTAVPEATAQQETAARNARVEARTAELANKYMQIPLPPVANPRLSYVAKEEPVAVPDAAAERAAEAERVEREKDRLALVNKREAQAKVEAGITARKWATASATMQRETAARNARAAEPANRYMQVPLPRRGGGLVRPTIGHVGQDTINSKAQEIADYLKQLRAQTDDTHVNRERTAVLDDFIRAITRAKFAERIDEDSIRSARQKINGASRRTRRQQDHF